MNLPHSEHGLLTRDDEELDMAMRRINKDALKTNLLDNSLEGEINNQRRSGRDQGKI
jgi:hypothetical protein